MAVSDAKKKAPNVKTVYFFRLKDREQALASGNVKRKVRDSLRPPGGRFGSDLGNLKNARRGSDIERQEDESSNDGMYRSMVAVVRNRKAFWIE